MQFPLFVRLTQFIDLSMPMSQIWLLAQIDNNLR